ncbi:MAG: ribonuclease PH, partial [Nesterenkonia sp.]
NVVATGGGNFVEIQGTAEGMPFTRGQLNELLDLAVIGTGRLTGIQKQALAE